LSTMDDSQIALFSLSHNLNMDSHAVFDDFACLNGTTRIGPLKHEGLKHAGEGAAIPDPYAEPEKPVDALGRDGDATGKALRIRWQAR